MTSEASPVVSEPPVMTGGSRWIEGVAAWIEGGKSPLKFFEIIFSLGQPLSYLPGQDVRVILAACRRKHHQQKTKQAHHGKL